MRRLLIVTLMLSAPLAAADFDYYLLTLSWAPDFCAQAKGGQKDPAECGTGRKVGFVVHGLWPQTNAGRGPESCGHASPVSAAIVQLMLNYIPTASLIQHEWQTHGTCTGLSAADYFALVRKARDSVSLPPQFQAPAQRQTLSPSAIEAAFQSANAGFPAGAFRTSCTGGTLQEARVCFAKDLTPIACTASAGECSSSSIGVLPVR